jgi:P27 family predicted phage terminase small subunit
MGTAKGGRPSTPTSLKVLYGNPGKRPISKNEPKPIPISPKPPNWLPSEAKTMWKHLAPQLEKLGLLTVIDGYSLTAVCQSYATWAKCQRYLIKNGMTLEIVKIDDDGNPYTSYIQQRPEVAIGNKALLAFKSFCTEFGLTPSSRAGIDIKPDSEELDPMEALLRSKGGG